MAYHYENLKLEKGMYGRSGRSFAQTLEELDPSEHYQRHRAGGPGRLPASAQAL